MALFSSSVFGASFQIEWGNLTTNTEGWTQVNLVNTYTSPVVVASPEYIVTSQAYGISTWITNVTSTSFLVRNSNENLNNADNVKTHYIVMEEGSWTLPGTTTISFSLVFLFIL